MLGILPLKWFLLFGILALLPIRPSAHAQETAESRAFKTASRFFQSGIYETAERQFQAFAAQFPQSPMLAEAVLLQARAALEMTNAVRAVSILNSQIGKAGLITDQYRYWLGRAHMMAGNHTAAAESYALLQRQFPSSDLLLDAAYGEAVALFKLREFGKVAALLKDANGAFQQSSKLRSNDRLSVGGLLLLAEAFFELKDFRAAEETAGQLASDSLKTAYPDYEWDRLHLLCRVQMITGQLTNALAQTTNLIAAARMADSRTMLADAVALQAGILRQMDRVEDAVLAYANNLAESVPSDRRRLALLNIIELKLAQDKTAEAGEMLREFYQRHPGDAASDVALLTSGELQMKLHYSATNEPPEAVATNRLQLALAQFEKVPPASPLRGKALLNSGWCLWLDGKTAESIPLFRAAAEALPLSEDLAAARFKLADGLYQQGDFTNAMRLYRSVTNDFAGVPRVRESLFDQVLYQIVRTSVQLGDVVAASETMQQVLDLYPESSFSERSMWVVGQELVQVKEPSRARQVFSEFVKRFPDRPLLPKIELAIARTYFHEGDYSSAISRYEEWLERYPTNELAARAEFNRAWANAKAGRATNAFSLFTNFVAQFPSVELARDAQYWVAEEYYRRSNYFEAQRSFQIITENTNWMRTNLTFQSRMMAGRSAFAAQRWKDASDHFAKLIDDADCPVDVSAAAYFALGDTIIRDDAFSGQDSTTRRPLEKFIDARTAFEKITQLPLYTTNQLAAPLVPLAWGRIGDCCLQLASQDVKQYDNATNAYSLAMSHRLANPSTRNLAQFGIAHALEIRAADEATLPAEKPALLKQALEHYTSIVIGANLRGNDEPDPVWVERAGFAAARLAEADKQWTVAIKIYERMHTVLAPLRPRIQERINRASEQLRNARD